MASTDQSTENSVPMEITQEEVDDADELREMLNDAEEKEQEGKYEESQKMLMITIESDKDSDSAKKVKEEAIYRISHLYTKTSKDDEVMELLKRCSPFFATIPKARTAKIVRTIIDIVAKGQDSVDLQVKLCEEVIGWCQAERRTFLRQRIQGRLADLRFQQGGYLSAQTLIVQLLSELKKLDDKQMLVEMHLVESRIHHALRNVPKSKAALTAARTAGNAIYIVPILQAELDSMAGILHCEEGDYKTAFSYFLEAFEAFDQAESAASASSASSGGGGVAGSNAASHHARAINCLKYMMLCKVLQGSAGEVSGLLSGKWGVKYSGVHLDAMDKIAKAAQKRSLEDFSQCTAKFEAQLAGDAIIKHHLQHLYNRLLEDNLLKIIEPFSCVEIAHVAELIKLPVEKVERKLSQMILDAKFQGILDQGRGQLLIYEPTAMDNTFSNSLEVVANVSFVVDSLFRRAQGLVR
eukprot:CAMPEP_0113935444 /NCGR_PEP_ID=MMETSP1339-20121228/2588_1 /TAXON_ID=94617 /ORGANISM="Fibrocapsa japonica" /LENGTH=466 /DNA_ID=CAMNT_0000937595 /DNA_START=21 /DNA_END=1421 /DNA_ORIENTATION=+ /assembly_acc=CAM_ASM_000762